MQDRKPPKKAPSRSAAARMEPYRTMPAVDVLAKQKELRQRIDEDTKELAAVRAVLYERGI